MPLPKQLSYGGQFFTFEKFSPILKYNSNQLYFKSSIIFINDHGGGIDKGIIIMQWPGSTEWSELAEMKGTNEFVWKRLIYVWV